MRTPSAVSGRAWWGAVALLCAACASRGANDTPPGAPDSAVTASGPCATGTVVAEGVDIAPRTWVHPADGPRIELLGTFVGNVRLLAGTTAEVCGPGRTPAGALEVTAVTLLRVDGMPAALGTLRAAPGGWALDPIGEDERLVLTAVPPDLERAVDRVVWVAGPREDGRLSVRSYSVVEGWR